MVYFLAAKMSQVNILWVYQLTWCLVWLDGLTWCAELKRDNGPFEYMVEWDWRLQIFTDLVREILTYFGVKIIFYFFFSIANWWLILFFITINCYFNTKLTYNAQTLHNKWWTHQSFYLLLLTGKKVSYKQFFMIKNLLNLILMQSCLGSIYTMFFFQDGEKTTHGSWTYHTLQVVKIPFHQMLKNV